MIKNIILTSAKENINVKGILSLETTSSKTLVNLKTYNFSKTLGKFVLAIKCGADLFKVDLDSGENYIIDKTLNLNDKISAVIVEIENNNSNILIWGSNETNKVWQNSFLYDFDDKKDKNVDLIQNKNVQSADAQNKEKCYSDENSFKLDKQSFDETERTSTLDSDDFSDYETDEEIEKIVDYSLNKFSETLDEDVEKPEDSQDNKSEFLNSVEEQINELLTNYEEEKALENIIPSSKFVKVNSENGNFYIFGVIYENNKIKYIVYGLPGEYSVKPDDEYANFYQWLPLNSENPQGYGYYLMYQDALSGNQVEIILD